MGGKEDEKIRGGEEDEKYGGVGLLVSSLGTYRDNLSGCERKEGGGIGRRKKLGGGMCRPPKNGRYAT